MCRSTGAIFWETRPATIIRSDWRGEARKSSLPKRAMSKRAAAVDIISMAQQARPNCTGQIELLRAQAMTRPALVVSNWRSSIFTSSGETPSPLVPGTGIPTPQPLRPHPPPPRPLLPLQGPPLPGVDEPDEQHAEEDQHLHQPDHAQIAKGHRPRVEEYRLDIKQDEEHRDQVVADGDAFPRAADGPDAGFVGFIFGHRGAPPAQERVRAQQGCSQQHGQEEVDEDREVRGHGWYRLHRRWAKSRANSGTDHGCMIAEPLNVCQWRRRGWLPLPGKTQGPLEHPPPPPPC